MGISKYAECHIVSNNDTNSFCMKIWHHPLIALASSICRIEKGNENHNFENPIISYCCLLPIDFNYIASIL